jgi:protein SCO1/2
MTQAIASGARLAGDAMEPAEAPAADAFGADDVLSGVAAPPGPLRLSPLWLAFAALALAVPMVPLLLAQPKVDLRDLGALPAFSLLDQDGNAFGAQDLAGKVWVADFIFTSCSDACPRLTARMRNLQDRLDLGEPIGLLSITVDPERDTPQKLAEYARTSGARTRLWKFVTGPQAEVERTVVKGFHIAMGRVPVEPASAEALRGEAFEILHGDRLVLVDGKGHLRGYYVADDAGLRQILRDARALLGRG